MKTRRLSLLDRLRSEVLEQNPNLVPQQRTPEYVDVVINCMSNTDLLEFLDRELRGVV